MKVYLMYRNRDWLLEQPLPSHHQELTQDLELNVLFRAMAGDDSFLFEVAKKVLFLSLQDVEDIRYRQDILRDCLKNPAVVRELYKVAVDAMELKKRNWLGIFTYFPGGVLTSALQMMDVFVVLLRRLRLIADQHASEFESEGFRRFFAMIQEELSEEYFGLVEGHLKALKFRDGVLVSATLGPGNEGTNYVLRKPLSQNRNWVKRVFRSKSPVYSFFIHPRDDHGARALSDLRDRGINLVANALAQSADHIDSFFKVLRLELAFYMACLNLAEKLNELEMPLTFPEPHPADQRKQSFRGLYDISLALTMKTRVVGNDVLADGKDLFIITGANQGGKSTFLRSIGQAQLMMQAGMFVAAEQFSANLCAKIFTHYRRKEDVTMKSGKLDEELSRMSVIVDQLVPHSLVLFNESFSATNEREGSEIARQITLALLERQMKVFFVTHQYEFAHYLYSLQMPGAMFLRAERKSGGLRTFKLIEGEPIQTSFATDIYQKVFGK